MNKLPLNQTESESEEIEVDLEYIITKKPPTNVVREFLRTNLCSIKNDDDLIFEI